MAWVRIDDDMPQHPKIIQGGPLAFAMNIAAIAYCNRHLTDGFLPRKAAATLWDFDGISITTWSNDIFGNGEDVDWKLIADDLVALGLWIEVDGGYQIHDYHDYQPMAKDIAKDRNLLSSKRAEAGRKGAARRWQNGKPDGKPMANDMANGYQTDSPNPKPVPNNYSDTESEPVDFLVKRLTNVCTGTNIEPEAKQVIKIAKEHVADQMIDEMIGYCETLDDKKKPKFPRYLLSMMPGWAGEYGIQVPEVKLPA